MRWRILALLFVARTGLGAQFQVVGSVGDDLAAAFGLDHSEIGLLIGLFMLPGLFLSLPAGFAGSYLSDRVLSAFGMLMLALGGLAAGLAPDPWLIGVGRMLCGVGFLLSVLYFTKMTADWFTGREIATAMGILVMSWPLGIAAGQVGYEWIAATAGWRWAFFAPSIFCAAAGAALFAGYRAPAAADAGAPKPTLRLSPRELQLTLIAALTWGLFNVGYITYLTFAPAILERHGASEIAAAGIVSIGSWIMIFSGAVCGQISDRSKRPDLILALCMLGAIAALALLAFEGGGFAASILFGAVGMAPAGIIMALTGEAMAPERRAVGMGIFQSLYFLMNAAAPPLAGWIYDLTQDPFDPILLGIFVLAAVVAANLWFRRVQKRSLPMIAAGL